MKLISFYIETNNFYLYLCRYNIPTNYKIMKRHKSLFLEKLTPTSISVDLFTEFVTQHQKSVVFVLLTKLLRRWASSHINTNYYKYVPSMSFWGNHFRTMTFLGSCGISSVSHFHRTVCSIFESSDSKSDTVSMGILDDFTTDPKLKQTTPSLALSTICFRSCKAHPKIGD